MDYYLVFGSIRRPLIRGGHFLDCSNPPVGVYQAKDAVAACQAAARDNGSMATYFAIPGVPWGVELLPSGATQLGRGQSAEERLASHLDRMEELNQRQKELEAAAAVQEQEKAMAARTVDLSPLEGMKGDGGVGMPDATPDQ